MDLLARSFPSMNMLFLYDVYPNHEIMPAQIPSMETLCIAYTAEPKHIRSVIELLEMNYLLKNFILNVGCDLQTYLESGLLLNTIRDRMPQLKELVLIGFQFQFARAIPFFNQCDSLERFQFNALGRRRSINQLLNTTINDRTLRGGQTLGPRRDYTIEYQLGYEYSTSFLADDRGMLECDYCDGYTVTLTKIYPQI